MNELLPGTEVDLRGLRWEVVFTLGAAGEREDSQRRRLAEVLARKADALLLLTATPHDGYDPHFASLVELLDPSLVDGRGVLRGDTYQAHVVRRLKRHIKDPDTGEPMFRTRDVRPIAVPLDRGAAPRFAAFQEALLALVAPQLRREATGGAYLTALELRTTDDGKVAQTVFDGAAPLERHFSVPFERQPVRDAAGPIDKPRQADVIQIGERRGLFRIVGTPTRVRGIDRTRNEWRAGPNLEEAAERFRRYLGERAARADELFKIMALMSREDVELIATLYAAWDDRLRDGRPATDADLVDDVLGWHEEKRQRFNKARIREKLRWLQNEGLVPRGSGVPLLDKPAQRRAEGLARRPDPVLPARVEEADAAEAAYRIACDLLQAKGEIASKDAQEAMGLSAAEVRPHLERLEREGLAITTGRTRGKKYVSTRKR